MPLFAFLLFGYLAGALRRLIAPTWPTLIPGRWWKYIMGTARDLLPIVGSMRRDRELGDVCQIFADGLARGRTMSDLFWDASAVITSPILRRRIQEWQRETDRGRDFVVAAEVAGMPTIMIGFLRTMRTGGTSQEVAQLMEFLAVHYRMKFSRTSIMVRAFAEPAMTLMLALLVGSFVVACFLPLVELIKSLSIDTGGAL